MCSKALPLLVRDVKTAGVMGKAPESDFESDLGSECECECESLPSPLAP